MSEGKYIQYIMSPSMDELQEEINKMMGKDFRWDLITVDSHEERNLGINQHIYKAWLQHSE